MNFKIPLKYTCFQAVERKINSQEKNVLGFTHFLNGHKVCEDQRSNNNITCLYILPSSSFLDKIFNPFKALSKG